MSEFEQGGYQTTESVSQEPSIQQEPTQTEPSSPQESQYFEIKYNKEPVKVSYDEAPTYIQKGMNYDKVQQQMQQYQQRMQDLTRFYGYQNENELFQALEQAKAEQQRQEYEQAGINPDVLNQFIEQHPAVQYSRQLQQQQQEQQRLGQEWGELVSEFPGLTPDQIPAEVFQLQQQRGVPLLDAYLRVNYKSLGQQKEQEAIQRIQQNNLSSPGSLGGGDVQHNTNVKSLSTKDFNSLVDQVLRGERKQL